MPVGVAVLKEPKEFVYVIQVFVNSKKGVEQQLVKLKGILNPKGILWVTYHKGTSKVKTGISREPIREYAVTVGLQAVTMVSINEDWAALRLKIVR